MLNIKKLADTIDRLTNSVDSLRSTLNGMNLPASAPANVTTTITNAVPAGGGGVPVLSTVLSGGPTGGGGGSDPGGPGPRGRPYDLVTSLLNGTIAKGIAGRTITLNQGDTLGPYVDGSSAYEAALGGSLLVEAADYLVLNIEVKTKDAQIKAVVRVEDNAGNQKVALEGTRGKGWHSTRFAPPFAGKCSLEIEAVQGGAGGDVEFDAALVKGKA